MQYKSSQFVIVQGILTKIFHKYNKSKTMISISPHYIYIIHATITAEYQSLLESISILNLRKSKVKTLPGISKTNWVTHPFKVYLFHTPNTLI